MGQSMSRGFPPSQSWSSLCPHDDREKGAHPINSFYRWDMGLRVSQQACFLPRISVYSIQTSLVLQAPPGDSDKILVRSVENHAGYHFANLKSDVTPPPFPNQKSSVTASLQAHSFIHSVAISLASAMCQAQAKGNFPNVTFVSLLLKWIFIDRHMEIAACVFLDSLINMITVNLRIIEKGSCKITRFVPFLFA